MRSTAEYIYSTLFEEGVNSDVTIVAVGVCGCGCGCVGVRPMRNLFVPYPGTVNVLLPW